MEKPKIARQIDDLVTYTERLLDPSSKDKCVFGFGPTSIGKSLMVKDALRRAGSVYQLVQNATKVGILDTLRRHPNAVILLDDFDDMWTDIPMLNVFKNALDNADSRVAHVNRVTMRKGQDHFTFGGKVIVLSNVDPAKIPAKYAEHGKAVRKRGKEVNISRDPMDLLQFIDYRVCDRFHFTSSQFYRDTGLHAIGLQAAQDVMRFIHTHAWRMETIDLRTLNAIAKERKLYPDGWEQRCITLYVTAKPCRDDVPPFAPSLVKDDRKLVAKEVTASPPIPFPKAKRRPVSSKPSDEVGTPEHIFHHYDKFYHFTLDVAATAGNAKCPQFFTKEQDGLSQEWSGVVWMNPPYSYIDPWVKKAWEFARSGRTVVALLPARTHRPWFDEYCTSGRVRFLKRPIKFLGFKQPAMFASMIVEWSRTLMPTAANRFQAMVEEQPEVAELSEAA